jgi:hypothetical protein
MSLPKGIPLSTPFQLLQAHPDDFKNLQHAYKQNTDLLKKVFYHPTNVEIIQKRLIKAVYDKTYGKFIIERQDPDLLVLAMQDFFPEVEKFNSAVDIRSQIDKLDDLVVAHLSSKVASNLSFEDHYLDQLGKPYDTMPDPVNTSVKGTRGYRRR